MTAAPSALIAPFARVARWWQELLPPRLRGLATVPQAALAGPPDRLPQDRPVRLVLPEDALLLREIALPAATDRARWRAHVEVRLEEVSPWAPGAYLWDARPLPGGAARYRVAMVPPGVLRGAEAALAARGCVVAELAGQEAGRTAFGFRSDTAQHQRWCRRLLGLWLAGVALGAGVGLWQMQAAFDARAEAATARATLAGFARRSAAGSATARAAVALAAAKTDAASLARALLLLARDLPGDAWLQSATLRPEGFELAGHAATLETIIPALQDGGAFAEVDFAGSSTRDPETGVFTFTVKGRLAPPPKGTP